MSLLTSRVVGTERSGARARVAWLVALVATATIGSSASAQPAPDAQLAEASDETRALASRHFRNGVELFEESAFEDALVEFRQAYETYPNPVVLYNIGQTYLALRRYVEAGEVLRDYLARMGEQVSPDRRREVETQLEALRRRIGRIRFVVNVAGADISIDGRSVGTAPFAEPLTVSIGVRRVVVRASGHQTVERQVSVAADQEIEVDINLEATSSTTIINQTVVADEERYQTTGMRVTMWSALGAAVALAGVTAWSTADAFSGDEDYQANPTLEGYNDGRRRVNRTYGLAAGTVALGATALICGFIKTGRRNANPEADDTDVAIVIDRNQAVGFVSHRF